MKKEIDIVELIPVGREYALSMSELALIAGIDKREVRQLVHKARASGFPICSTCEKNSGYYIPLDYAEARIYYGQQIARIRSAFAALYGVKKFMKGEKQK